MEEKKPTHIKLKAIKSGSTCQVEIGSGMYTRIQELLFWYVNGAPAERSIKALDDLSKREPKDQWEYHFLTIMSLVYSTEAAFDVAGAVEDKKVPLPENK